MAEDIKVNNLIINQLSNEKFATIEKDPTQLYLTPDTSIDASEKGVAGGVATLDSNVKVPTAQIPALPYLPTSGGTVNGKVTLESANPILSIKTSGYQSILSLDNSPKYEGDVSGKYNIGCLEKQLFIYRGDRGTTNSIRIDLDGNLERVKNGQSYEYLTTEDKAVPNGVASLGADGKVPAEQLPASIGGGGKSLGEVFFSPSKKATDNPGGLPLWTGEYYSNASSLYPDFYAWVKSHTELCKTKTQYDAAISTYGECPYYVVDEVAGSLRLPKLVNYLKMANSMDGITQSGAGLPNITGSLTLNKQEIDSVTGAFSFTGPATNGLYAANGAARTGNYGTATLDASQSYDVYGNSNTVTPAHTTLYPWVYAFNRAVSASEAQAAEFTGALSGKANTDLSNVSSTVKASLLDLLAMDTTRGVSLPSGTTLTQNGWIVCSFTDHGYGVAQFQLDGVTTFQWSYQSVANTRKGTCYGGKGQVFTITTSGNCTAVATFYPLKGD